MNRNIETKASDMAPSNQNPARRFSSATMILLCLAAVAVVGLVVPWCVDDVHGKRGIAWRQSLAALLVAIIGLSTLLIWFAGWMLVAALGVALYFPIDYELTRRHAVLSLRASGAEVTMLRQFPGGLRQGAAWELFLWLQSGGLAWQSEGVLYSLESVGEIKF